jgi:exosortase/archaeosortase family protein
VAVGVAVLHVALAWRLAAIDGGRSLVGDYALTVSIGWVAALCLVWERRASTPATGNPVSRAIGSLLILVSVVGPIVRPEYGPVDRVLPLLAGGGLLLLAGGLPVVAWHRAGVVLLSLPLINPLPKAVQDLIAPTHFTAESAMVIVRAMGKPATLEGDTIVLPGGTLDVLPGCSGLLGISRLWVLAVLAIALFSPSPPLTPTGHTPPSSPKNSWVSSLWSAGLVVVLSATLVGFLMNAMRIALLAGTAARGDDAAFEYWHQGRGAEFFSLGSVVAAGIVWWWVLRAADSSAPAWLRPSGSMGEAATDHQTGVH